LNITGGSGSGLAVSVDKTWSLIGIVSGGRAKNQQTPNETCDLSDCVLYTDVAKFHSWINRVIMETDWDTDKNKSPGKGAIIMITIKIHIFCSILLYILIR
jgi:hypothetical protein